MPFKTIRGIRPLAERRHLVRIAQGAEKVGAVLDDGRSHRGRSARTPAAVSLF